MIRIQFFVDGEQFGAEQKWSAVPRLNTILVLGEPRRDFIVRDILWEGGPGRNVAHVHLMAATQ